MKLCSQIQMVPESFARPLFLRVCDVTPSSSRGRHPSALPEYRRGGKKSEIREVVPPPNLKCHKHRRSLLGHEQKCRNTEKSVFLVGNCGIKQRDSFSETLVMWLSTLAMVVS